MGEQIYESREQILAAARTRLEEHFVQAKVLLAEEVGQIPQAEIDGRLWGPDAVDSAVVRLLSDAARWSP